MIWDHEEEVQILYRRPYVGLTYRLMCRLAKADRRVRFPYLTPCSIRITANMSAFQAEDTGSIPVWDSIIISSWCNGEHATL